jgi:hypothetical protein
MRAHRQAQSDGPVRLISRDFGAVSRWGRRASGGEGGIRTLGTREGTTVFETAPIDRSGTSPDVTSAWPCGRRHLPGNGPCTQALAVVAAALRPLPARNRPDVPRRVSIHLSPPVPMPRQLTDPGSAMPPGTKRPAVPATRSACQDRIIALGQLCPQRDATSAVPLLR